MTSFAVRRHVIAPANPAPIDRRWDSRLTAVYGLDWGVDAEPDGSLYYARSEPQMRNVLGNNKGGMHSYFASEMPVPTMTEIGRGLYYDGTKNAYTAGLTGLANGASPDEACIVCFIPMSSSGSQNLMGYSNVWSTSLSDYGRGVGIEGGQLMAWGASAVNLKRFSVTLPALNTFNVVGVRFSASGAIYLNGVEMADAKDFSHSWGYYLAAGSAHGVADGSGVARFTGKLALRAWFRDGLTNAELEELTANPLKLFAPRRRLYLVGAAPPAGTTINATVGNAVAAGSAATVSSAITVAATTGNAAAAGSTASVASSITIAATVGNAAAAGSTAAIESSVTIGAGIGDAVAAGTTASITTGASVDCTVGDAVATGAQATISSAITIAANVGNSVAAGSTADVSTATVVACTTGNATAAGLAASISGTVSIVCSVGDAVAAGSAASITAAGALNAAEIADAVWDEPMVDAITARTIMSGMADFLRSRGHLP